MIGSSEQDSLRGVAAMMKELVMGAHVNADQEDKMSYWQLIFSSSYRASRTAASTVARSSRQRIGSGQRTRGFRNG